MFISRAEEISMISAEKVNSLGPVDNECNPVWQAICIQQRTVTSGV